jgi:hypothetical protein
MAVHGALRKVMITGVGINNNRGRSQNCGLRLQ